MFVLISLVFSKRLWNGQRVGLGWINTLSGSSDPLKVLPTRFIITFFKEIKCSSMELEVKVLILVLHVLFFFFKKSNLMVWNWKLKY